MKNQKKSHGVEKSCLPASDRSKNMLSVQHVLEILCDNNRLPNQFLLSSEIGAFEVVTIKFDENPMKSNEIHMKSLDCFNGKPSGFGDFHQNLMTSTSNGPISELKGSWTGKRLLPHSNPNPCCSLSMFLERSEACKHDFSTPWLFFVFFTHPGGPPNDLL